MSSFLGFPSKVKTRKGDKMTTRVYGIRRNWKDELSYDF